MTDANWAILEKMISKIMENCMEQSLYEELSKKLGGKTMSIEFNGGEESSFSFDGSTAGISLDATGESNRLFYELWHAHQAYGGTSSAYSNYKYDDDRMGLRNFTNLRKLTINC